MDNSFKKYLKDTVKDLEKEQAMNLDYEQKSDKDSSMDFIMGLLLQAFITAFPQSKEHEPHLREMILYFLDQKVPASVIMKGVQILLEMDENETDKN